MITITQSLQTPLPVYPLQIKRVTWHYRQGANAPANFFDRAVSTQAPIDFALAVSTEPLAFWQSWLFGRFVLSMFVLLLCFVLMWYFKVFWAIVVLVALLMCNDNLWFVSSSYRHHLLPLPFLGKKSHTCPCPLVRLYADRVEWQAGVLVGNKKLKKRQFDHLFLTKAEFAATETSRDSPMPLVWYFDQKHAHGIRRTDVGANGSGLIVYFNGVVSLDGMPIGLFSEQTLLVNVASGEYLRTDLSTLSRLINHYAHLYQSNDHEAPK